MRTHSLSQKRCIQAIYASRSSRKEVLCCMICGLGQLSVYKLKSGYSKFTTWPSIEYEYKRRLKSPWELDIWSVRVGWSEVSCKARSPCTDAFQIINADICHRETVDDHMLITSFLAAPGTEILRCWWTFRVVPGCYVVHSTVIRESRLTGTSWETSTVYTVFYGFYLPGTARHRQNLGKMHFQILIAHCITLAIFLKDYVCTMGRM